MLQCCDTSDELVAFPPELPAVRQVSTPRHDEEAAVCTPCAFKQRLCAEGLHLGREGWLQTEGKRSKEAAWSRWAWKSCTILLKRCVVAERWGRSAVAAHRAAPIPLHVDRVQHAPLSPVHLLQPAPALCSLPLTARSGGPPRGPHTHRLWAAELHQRVCWHGSLLLVGAGGLHVGSACSGLQGLHGVEEHAMMAEKPSCWG